MARSKKTARPTIRQEEGEIDGPKSGTVAVVGRPNVGKSTLLNALVGERLASATSKPQTTRARLLAVAHVQEPPTQIAFVDTPGLHRPKNALGRALVEEAKAALGEVHAVVLVVECDRTLLQTRELGTADLEALAAARTAEKPIVLALNKVDRVRDKTQLLPIVERLVARHGFDAVVPLSATRRLNVDALVKALRAHLDEGATWDDDFLTDRSERFFVAEMIREQVISHTHEEVPHAVAVMIERYENEAPKRPGAPGLSRIAATAVVEKDGQKKILIGAKGAMLKEIGTAARLAIEAFLGRRVHLELWVKVVPSWTDDAQRVRELVQAGG